MFLLFGLVDKMNLIHFLKNLIDLALILNLHMSQVKRVFHFLILKWAYLTGTFPLIWTSNPQIDTSFCITFLTSFCISFLHYILRFSIIYSQALRVSRICCSKSNFLKHLETMKFWLIDYSQMTVILFLVQWCQKTVSDFSKATFVSTTHKKEDSCGKQIDFQLLERSGKSSTHIFQSMLHHRNIFQLMIHYTQWDSKLSSASIIPISHIVMVCYWSHWMMQDFVIHTKLYRMLQNRRLEMALLLEVYHWLHNVFSNRNGSWSTYHRQNHLDRSSLHKYWVNKLASRSRHCNSWDIAEREKWNTVWPFWHPKQWDF